MPNLEEMTCVICGEVFAKEKLKEGLCEACAQAMDAAAAQIDEVSSGTDADEELTDSELTRTIAAYKRRQEYMKTYNTRPEVAAKRKQYMAGRAARDKALLKKAKDLGLL